MPSQPEISSQMLAQLQVVEPDLDTSIGTTVRKIVDVTAETIAEGYVDQFFQGYQYDIDTLTGAALDDFVALFGFQRFAAKRSTGIVTFARPTPSLVNFLIPAGTTVATSSVPAVVFQAVIPVLLAVGASTVDVPVQAAIGGLSGNVAANAISTKVTPLEGVSTMANLSPTTGGADAEGDAALRDRFKKTIFRGFTGTEGMFLGTALENPNVTLANVIGAAKTRIEQIQIISGTGQSTLQSAKYIYPYNYFFGLDPGTGLILNPGVNYSFGATTPALATPAAPTLVGNATAGTLTSATSYSYRIAWANAQGQTLAGAEASAVPGGALHSMQITWPTPPIGAVSVNIYGRSTGAELLLATVPVSAPNWIDTGSLTPAGALPGANTTGFAPTVTVLDAVHVPDGIYQLQFDYLPVASRDDPVNGITNRVDLYVNGDDATAAVETISFSHASVFSTSSASPFYYLNFAHKDLTPAVPGRLFQQLTFSPVTDLPSTIVSGAVTYHLGVDYFLVNDITNKGGAAHSMSGIEWIGSFVALPQAAVPTDGTQLSVSYVYNAVPRKIETDIRNWRLVGYDVWVHQAKTAIIDVALVVILLPGYSSAGVMSTLTQSLQALIGSIGFDGVLQVSDILTAAGAVPGIDAVRIATSADAPIALPGQYGIYQVAPDTIDSISLLVVPGRTVQNYSTSFNGVSRATDAYFNDDTLPVLGNVYLTVRAQNAFSSGS